MRKPKILTITLNPALDEIIRGKTSTISPGGKGVNVSRALAALGYGSTALVAVAGPSGRALMHAIREEGLSPVALRLAGEVRINKTVIAANGRMKRVMGQGPLWRGADVKRLEAALTTLVPGREVVIFSGSLPPGMPEGIYARLVRLAGRQGAKVFLDTSGEGLLKGVAARPWGIKPNQQEAQALGGQEIRSRRAAKKALQCFLDRGMKRVVLTLAQQGLAASDGIEYLWAAGPRYKGHGVGCGDAALAGFVAGMQAGVSFQDQVRWAAATGAAAARTDRPGGIDRGVVQKILKQVTITAL